MMTIKWKLVCSKTKMIGHLKIRTHVILTKGRIGKRVGAPTRSQDLVMRTYDLVLRT